MAVLATTNPTLADVAKRLDPDGKIAMIVEILNQTNEVLDDMPWIDGNLPTGHRSTIRTGIPAPTWRKLYGGVQPSRSTTAQVTDNCGMLENFAESDKALADLNGNTAAFRLSEERPIIEGISQELAKTLFYGNEGTLPESLRGSPRASIRGMSPLRSRPTTCCTAAEQARTTPRSGSSCGATRRCMASIRRAARAAST